MGTYAYMCNLSFKVYVNRLVQPKNKKNEMKNPHALKHTG